MEMYARAAARSALCSALMEEGKAREKVRILGEWMQQKLSSSTEKGMTVDEVIEVGPYEPRTVERQEQTEGESEGPFELYLREGRIKILH